MTEVKVRPLEWKADETRPETSWTADTPWGRYRLFQAWRGAVDGWGWVCTQSEEQWFHTLESAKAAAQAGCEARIRSALLPDVLGMAEQVAWAREWHRAVETMCVLIGINGSGSPEEILAELQAKLAAPPAFDLREENERLKKAATGLSRVLLPIHMQLAERDLIEDPVADDVTLFSFMGSGASDRVTVGEYRKAMAALDVALGGLQTEGK